jgi:hypothetical protein
MIRHVKSVLLCAALASVTFGSSAGARHHGGADFTLNYSTQTGGYCDRYGCPDHFWTYPIFYGPVFYHGVWYRGPVYTRDDGMGHHWFWVRGDWHRDEWRHSRPYWARDVHFGPPLDFSYYENHGFNEEGRWRHEHDSWGGDHRDASNGDYGGGQGDYHDHGHDQAGYQGGDQWNHDHHDDQWNHDHQGDQWNHDHHDDHSGDNGWRPDQSAANGPPNGYNDHGHGDWNGGGNGHGGDWHDHGGQGPQGNGQQTAQAGSGNGGAPGPNSGGPNGNANGPNGNQHGSDHGGPGGNGGPPTASNPPPANTITVTTATYGASCHQNKGNVTKFLQDACNGHDKCDYTVRYQTIGDPAPGCAKDFSVEWTCSAGSGGTANVPAEAGLGSNVTLQCATSHG